MPVEKREKVDATEFFFFSSCLSFLFGWNAYCRFLHLLLLGERELLLCERRVFFFLEMRLLFLRLFSWCSYLTLQIN